MSLTAPQQAALYYARKRRRGMGVWIYNLTVTPGQTTAAATIQSRSSEGTISWTVKTPGGTLVDSDSATVVAAGTQNIAPNGLTALTAYILRVVHTDVYGRESRVVSSAFTTTA